MDRLADRARNDLNVSKGRKNQHNNNSRPDDHSFIWKPLRFYNSNINPYMDRKICGSDFNLLTEQFERT